MTIQKHTRPVRTMQVYTRLCKDKKTIYDQTLLHKTKYLTYQSISIPDRKGQNRTKQEHTGPHKTIHEHTGPYRTVQEDTGSSINDK